jgi:ribosomal protein L11 methyltransferase
MEWTEVKIYTTTEGIEPVSAVLLDTGVTGIQVEDDKELKQYLQTSSEYWDYVDEELLNKPEGETKIIVYVSDNPYGEEILHNIRGAIEGLKSTDTGLDLGRLAIETTSSLNDEEWLNKWKDFYKPFCVGNRIFVKPVWEDIEAPDGRVTFNINPGHVFGTGLHQTTQLCMLQLEKYINEESVVADLGCGSGILSVVALLLGAKSAFAVDIDANAIKTAYENAELSGVDKSKYYVTSGNVISDVKLQDEIGYGKYDVVVANIIADVICAISPTVPKMLKDNGVFIASGIIKDRLEDVYEAMKQAGLKVTDTSIKDEWVSVTAVKE